MKKLVNLKGAKALTKNEQKVIHGGNPPLKPDCYPGTDAICCGTQQWQCGTGPECGGYYDGTFCNCV